MSEQYKAVSIPKQPGSQYTDDQRLAVITDYMVLGNQTRVSELHNIPKTTVHQWIRSDWGIELLEQIRTEKGEELDANLTKLIDSAFEQAQDRVDNGDYRVSKEGTLIRVPMGGRDLVISGATVYDKRQLHRNQPTAIRGDNASVQALAAEFKALAQSHKNIQNSVVIDQTGGENDSGE